MYSFAGAFAGALGLRRVVLDFGTRLRLLTEFAALPEAEEVCLIEVIAGAGGGAGKRRPLFAEGVVLEAVFPVCAEDIRKRDGYTDVGLANDFGLAVKEVCDRITGERL